MVMEAPTPQCVGLEFVRQYYTILNKAPCHLHRFYANNSSFMHGGENSNREPIIGQSNIHKCIKELNFKDCHAKILLIDSQATMADGVVIQVTGELSNDGRPMRRFMQTFVLAPQSEKKYYVHNDIFRYQDQVFNDDCDGSGEEGPDDVVQHDNGHVEDLQPPPQQQAALPQEVVVVAPAAAIPGVQESVVNASAGVGVAMPVVGVSGQQTPQVVNDYVAVPVATAHHHQAPSAAVLASVALPQQPQQVIPSQQGSTTLPSAQALPPQQQQLNGNISSSPELAAVKPAAALQQQSSPVVASAAAPMHSHHTAAIPSAPSTAPQPPTSPQASVAPRQASPHLSRQVENMNNSSSPGTAQQSAPQEDGWSTSAGDWNAPASSQPSRQQQPVSNSRSGVASPPQQATKLAEKPEAAPIQSQQTTTYAGFFKNSGGSSTSSNTASTTPSSNVQQQQQPASRQSQSQYQSREMAPRSGLHSSSGSQQHRDRNEQQQQGGSHGLHNQHQQQQYSRDRDGGFQRTGRGGRPVSYRSRNANYSESGGDHINAEDGCINNMENSGYGGGPLEDRRRGPQAGVVPDTHQIFVGNLPQSMHDDELRQVFETYGSIIDVRINVGKGKLGVPSNGKPSGPVPNFGFITFDDEVAVSRCLKDRPIKINGDHRLNVEEKKTKSKVDGGSYNRPNMRPPMHQGGRGGGSFGRGEGRGRGGYNTGPRR